MNDLAALKFKPFQLFGLYCFSMKSLNKSFKSRSIYFKFYLVAIWAFVLFGASYYFFMVSFVVKNSLEKKSDLILFMKHSWQFTSL